MGKICCLSYLLIGLVCRVNAQLLWKISGNGLTKPSYVFATHHMAPFSIRDSIAGLKTAQDETLQVYGEVEIGEAAGAMAKMPGYVLLPGDTTLRTLFTPEQYGRVNDTVKKYLNFDLDATVKAKPAFIAQMITLSIVREMTDGFDPQRQIDALFQQDAAAKGKKTGGLESLDFQMELLYNSQPPDRQAQQLYGLVCGLPQEIAMNKKLIELYMRRDLDGLYECWETCEGPSSDVTPAERAAMLDNRNAAWVARLPSLMREAPTLVVVGAMHLPGKNGVLNLLKQKGYIVEGVE